eukprot:1466030-Pyramimonas_sp.AAC.1
MEHDALPQRERRTRKRREPCPETVEPAADPNESDNKGGTICEGAHTPKRINDAQEAGVRGGQASSPQAEEEQVQAHPTEGDVPAGANYECK